MTVQTSALDDLRDYASNAACYGHSPEKLAAVVAKFEAEQNAAYDCGMADGRAMERAAIRDFVEMYAKDRDAVAVSVERKGDDVWSAILTANASGARGALTLFETGTVFARPTPFTDYVIGVDVAEDQAHLNADAPDAPAISGNLAEVERLGTMSIE